MSWKRISFLAVSFLFLRGLLLLCVLPPFEGMDEYQHLGYIVFLLENGRIPTLGKDTIPDSVLRGMRDFPLPDHAVRQTASWGTQSYADFWNRRSPSRAEGGPLELYQAQHPPLFYFLMSLLYPFLSPAGLLSTMTLLRLLNLLFLSAGTYFFFLLLEKLIPDLSARLWILGLVSVYPLYLINGCRVANDSLAIFWGLLSLVFLFRYYAGGSLRDSCWGGICLVLGIWTKSTMMAWIPLWPAVLVLRFFHRKDHRSRRKEGLAIVLFLGMVTLFCGPLFHGNLVRYGSPSPMVEFTYSAFHQREAQGLWRVLLEIEWLKDLARFLGRVWIGGWSFLKLPRWLEILYSGLIFLPGGMLLLRRLYLACRERTWLPRMSWKGRNLFRSIPEALLMTASILLCLAGMFYHVWMSQATYGVPSTNAWYFMMALPPFACLLFQGVHFLHPGWGRFYFAFLVSFLLLVDFWGLFFRMAPFYTDSNWSLLLWDRLSMLHPWFLPSWLIPLFLAGMILPGFRLAALLYSDLQKKESSD